VHTEQEMLFSLVTQKVFTFDVKNSMDVTWDIRLESFSDFYTRSDNVLFTFKGFDRKKSKVLIDWTIDTWTIELGNWHGGYF
jgi:hypothetical protein